MSQNTARISEIIDNAKVSPYQILILSLCFLIVLLDGFDTAIIGYIAPALREEWDLLPAQLSPAFGAGLFGLLLGSLIFGPIADAIGRKRVLLVSILIFGGGTLASAYTHSIESLTLLRLITGIGLGGAMPTCITLSSEYSPARRRMIMVTLSWSGFTAGLALGGLLAGQIIPVFGWRGVLTLGGIAPLLLLPLLAWQMPESVRFMASSPKHAAGLRQVVERITGKSWAGVTILDDERPTQARSRSPMTHLFTEGRAVRTLLLWAAFFCSLFVFYQLTSWLPSILKDAGYDIVHASRIGAMLPLGGTLGAILMALLMDRVGPYPVLALSYLGAALVVGATGYLMGGRLHAGRHRVPCRLRCGRRTERFESGFRHYLPHCGSRHRGKLGDGEWPLRLHCRLHARCLDDCRCRFPGDVLYLAGATGVGGFCRHLPALPAQFEPPGICA